MFGHAENALAGRDLLQRPPSVPHGAGRAVRDPGAARARSVVPAVDGPGSQAAQQQRAGAAMTDDDDWTGGRAMHDLGPGMGGARLHVDGALPTAVGQLGPGEQGIRCAVMLVMRQIARTAPIDLVEAGVDAYSEAEMGCDQTGRLDRLALRAGPHHAGPGQGGGEAAHPGGACVGQVPTRDRYGWIDNDFGVADVHGGACYDALSYLTGIASLSLAQAGVALPLPARMPQRSTWAVIVLLRLKNETTSNVCGAVGP